MARLESKVDLMHVPTPRVVTERLRALLNVPDTCVCLDPCCGTGAALADLAPNRRLYGVEIEIERAREAGDMLQVLTCAMQDARISHNTFGLMLLNPPYDASTEGRLERVFLNRCTKYLRPDGVLILIIKISEYPVVSHTLRRHYDVIGHWRFPDGWFDGPELAFHQTVLVAKRRLAPSIDRDPLEFHRLLKLDDGIEPLPEQFEQRVTMAAGDPPSLFASGVLSEADLINELAHSPVPRVMRIPNPIGCGSPPVTLKQGHIALTLASGLINGVYGEGARHHVAKGTIIRQETTTHDRDETADGRTVVIEKITDSFAIKIRALTPKGVIHDMIGGPPPKEEST